MKTKKEVYSEKLSVGRRTYFFDVKENMHKEKYLVITESKKNRDNGFSRDRIVIFEECIKDFSNTFNRLTKYMDK